MDYALEERVIFKIGWPGLAMELTTIKECLGRILPFYSSVLAVVNVRCRLVKVNLSFQFSSHMTLMETQEQLHQV